MPAQYDSQTIAGFYEEAQSYLAPLAECVQQLRAKPADEATLTEIHRFAHLIRGASAVVGLPRLTELTGDLESFLENILAGILPWEDSQLETIAEVASLIELQLRPEPQSSSLPAASEVAQVDPEVLAGFLVEAEEALGAVSQRLGHLPDQGALLEVRRAVHTVKGAAAMVGLSRFSSLAHRMEDALDALTQGELAYDDSLRTLFHRSLDLMADLVTAGGSHPDIEQRLAPLLERYAALLPLAPATAPAITAAVVEEAYDPAPTVRVPLESIDEIIAMVTEIFIHRFSFERSLDRFGHELSELSFSLRRLKQIGTSFELDNVLTDPAAASSATPQNPEFDPLEFDRYSRLYTHSRDLTEATADVGAAEAQFRVLSGDFDAFLNRERRLTSQLQDRLLRFRMVPLSSVAARFERTVRVAAEQAGKQATLLIDGLATGIDKTMLDTLLAPLEHLLRNAVAHGVETPEARLAAGKPTTGQIRLSASHNGARIVLRLEDDGGGLDTQLIRQRAIATGLASENSSPEELYNLLFRPGFTTAGAVTELSGRGLGLDIVKSTVQGLKGTIALESTPGQGTAFTIQLPLTLAIRRVLLVQSAGSTFAIPIASVSQVARLEEASLERKNGIALARFGNQQFPVHDLAGSLRLSRAPGPESAPPKHLPAILLRDSEAEFALTVDKILEAREVVIKPLSPLLGQAAHLAGATLLGETIIPVLNPSLLGRPIGPAGEVATPAVLNLQPSTHQQQYQVLIVDDSLSVRRVIATLLSRQGWTPSQAKDGVEALELLRKIERLPDLILMDVEMPRMDGFELTTLLRGPGPYNKIPIVMLTSRSGEKHRNKAFACGVSDYLVKPYQDDHLLSTIRSNIKRARALQAS